MQYNKLGKSAIEVSSIGLGCMSLKGSKHKQGVEIIRKAFDSGINFFDTADLYEKGFNEMLVGEAVQDFRKRIVLSTKVGNSWRADGNGWDWKASKSYIVKTVESSLSRLKTDYIDLYQLHGGTIEDPIDEIIEAFDLLVSAGKIRTYGLSSIRSNVIREYVAKSNISAVMMQYSLLDRRLEEEMGAYLLHHRISVLARGAVAKGMLINKQAENFLQYSSSEVQHIIRNLHAFAKKHHVNNLTVALSFVLSNEAVTAALLGINTPLQLTELIQIKEQVRSLTGAEKIELLSGVRALYFTEHR
ncbi:MULTISPECIES: aldo/keto reductase [Sphingobacterium]|uniref:Aldo/keto reductase n=1 Tax=Sphingobacterium kitahiroshimense TaxID=470446 RepID=A0ABV0BY54_9SPHI|nr:MULTISPECIES: aldo/keto reductase [unclassified Sphingobacterium]KKX49967.1 oxidoreductase [Sphingobacterium sp. IITKGP-BTPF85]MCS3556337.1 aryl-alcohol dehydrogenase-like predicted oxidoreductase [Sphingobacterium sp. JUb21]NJI72116.1 aldo/keto reductase [Sphingobacterium sp. B16(2022)]QQD12081.1 aldo/keto reductase [Sphingobacterium sp. UDSM-2020]TCR08706.1 aryl-alcohol dehydrogenase-like predicted oxidoreductase [Sphingobacterium sp. JUb20]